MDQYNENFTRLKRKTNKKRGKYIRVIQKQKRYTDSWEFQKMCGYMGRR